MDPKGAVNSVEKIVVVTDKRKQLFVFGFFTAIVVIVLLVGAIAPSIRTISTLLAEIKEKEVLRDDLVLKKETLSGLQTQYDNISGQLRDIELIFPNNGDFSLILANIEAVAESNGYEMQNITFSSSEPPEDITGLVIIPKSVTFVVQGPTENMIPLLKSIEAMPMFPIIDTVSYNLSEEETDETAISIQVVIYEISDVNFYE